MAGEFCGNGRNMFQKLSDRSDLDLKELKYCIFGLGDSHYWGKGTEELSVHLRVDSLRIGVEGPLEARGKGRFGFRGSREESKFNFAKPARDLDSLLEKMGAQRMMPTGFGDDQENHLGSFQSYSIDDDDMTSRT